MSASAANKKTVKSATKIPDDEYLSFKMGIELRTKRVTQRQGITIDIRCDLDFEEWETPSPLGYERPLFGAKVPELVFPWATKEWRDLLRADGPVVEVLPGDRIFVDQIRPATMPTSFAELDHPAHTHCKLAYLKIERGDGTIVPVVQPLVFVRADAVFTQVKLLDHYGAYRAMLSRLEDLLGVEDVEEMVDKPLEQWRKIPEDAPARTTLASALIALRDRDDIDGHAMAAFGYMMGRAEAEVSLLSPAKRGLESVRNVHRASLAKRAKDREGSEPIRDQARAVIKTQPDISLTMCANLVSVRVGKDARWVSRQIKELFERRPNGREYRPKPLAAGRTDRHRGRIERG